MINRGNRLLEKAQRFYFNIGLSAAVLIALILPIGYFSVSYTHMSGGLESEADINATLISGVIKLNPELWRYEEMRLQELLSTRPRFGHAETRRILDSKYTLIAESVNDLPPPVMTRACDLLDGKVLVGRVEISRSLFPTLLVTGITALIGSALGLLIFALLWELAFRRLILAERQRREFIEKIMENGPHAVMVLTPEGCITTGNAHSLQLTGLSAEELAGRAFASLFQGGDTSCVQLHLTEVATAKVAMANLDAKLVPGSKGTLYVTCTVSPLVLEGKVVNLLVSVQDVSSEVKAHQDLRLYADDLARQIKERRKAEDALRQSEARFRRLLQDVGSVAVRGYAPDGTTQYWNQAAERLYGYSAKEAIGGNLAYLLGSQDPAEQVKPKLRQGPGQGQPPLELTLRHKDGSPVSVYSSQVTVCLPGRAEEIFFIDVDLSERNKNQEEKTRLEAKLQQAQKMELIGRLAGGVAHDFNNMLTVILGYANMALLDMDGSERFHANFTEIFRAAERSANLTRQLLAFARKQAIEPEVLDLNKTVGGMISMVQRLIGEAILLDWKPADDLWPVKMDRSQVDQILANLCINARDAIKEIGAITVETGNRSLDADYFTDRAWCKPGDFVRLAVRDTGRGIDPEVLPHIFEPFYTTKGVGKGTGLGLATVYGIVKQNKGFINVLSEDGQGTEFEIFLPRFTGPTDELPMGGATTRPPSGKETILLVEDEPTVLKLTKKMLTSLDYNVLAARNPVEALNLARECEKEIHLVLTDVVLPDMNGCELAKGLRALYPHLKLLFMSGYTANVIESYGALSAEMQILHKPFSQLDLGAKVREVLDNR